MIELTARTQQLKKLFRRGVSIVRRILFSFLLKQVKSSAF